MLRPLSTKRHYETQNNAYTTTKHPLVAKLPPSDAMLADLSLPRTPPLQCPWCAAFDVHLLQRGRFGVAFRMRAWRGGSAGGKRWVSTRGDEINCNSMCVDLRGGGVWVSCGFVGLDLMDGVVWWMWVVGGHGRVVERTDVRS
jgi:hypothetical protein